jgi:hypothetical protein
MKRRPTTGQRKSSRPSAGRSRPTTGQRKSSRPSAGRSRPSAGRSRPVTGQTLVFVGPTMKADEVRVLLPDAIVRPPAAVGDILRAAYERGVQRIAIIDGYFERMAAVWHKEILIALERGIEVWGAASMGALRAAELGAYGMRGVGEIFKLYKRGAFALDELRRPERRDDLSQREPRDDRPGFGGFVTADDEVAVAHLPAEYGYKPVSDALINIRYNLDAAAHTGLVSRATAERLLSLARARFYRERSWTKLLEDAREAKLPANEVAAIDAMTKLDRKADDARLLLGKLRRCGKQARRKIRVPRTWALRQLERLML